MNPINSAAPYLNPAAFTPLFVPTILRVSMPGPARILTIIFDRIQYFAAESIGTINTKTLIFSIILTVIITSKVVKVLTIIVRSISGA